MRSWLLLCCVLTLIGCAASPPRVTQTEHLFDDSLFKPPLAPVVASAVLALTPAMRSYIKQDILPLVRSLGAQRALVEALYAKGQLLLEYDAMRTRNAAEAFEARAGNCLSLVIMTAAFAREMGLDVRFQTVVIDSAWERSGDLYFVIGHVNLMLGQRSSIYGVASVSTEWMTVDFVPGQDLQRWPFLGLRGSCAEAGRAQGSGLPQKPAPIEP